MRPATTQAPASGSAVASALIANGPEVLPLAGACVVAGLIGVAGTGWVGHWTRRLDRDRARERSAVRVS